MGRFSLSRRTRDATSPARTDADRPPDTTEPHDDDLEETGARMSFLEHLDELRRRIVWSMIGIAVGCAVAFVFIARLYDFIMLPLWQMLPEGSRLVYTEPTEAFVLYLKIAFLAGILISAPWVIWQVWLFIAPGLYVREKRMAIPFVLLSTIGFIGGAAFSHYLLFPWMWRFLASFSTGYTMFMPKIESVFSLYVKMMLGMGLVFQMPSLVYFLARLGLVTAGFLARHFKYAVLIIFVVAAVVTPSGDMLTQTLFAAPMLGLYIISIGIAWIVGVGRRRRAAATAAAD